MIEENRISENTVSKIEDKLISCIGKGGYSLMEIVIAMHNVERLLIKGLCNRLETVKLEPEVIKNGRYSKT